MLRSDERGVAIIMALFMTLLLSAIAASMAYVARTETLSSQSYTTMSQARYAAESGLAAATNYLLSSQYPMPSPTPGLAGYNTNFSPVSRSTDDDDADEVELSTETNASNYPDAAVVVAFGAAASGSLPVGVGTAQYGARATLLAMRPIDDKPGASIVQTWEVTGTGRLGGSGSAQVDVSAIVERQTVPLYSYAAFATNAGCDALTMAGGAITDSYDSEAALGAGGAPATAPSKGDVGANGNVSMAGGNTTINGTLSTPRTGVGSCTAGNVTAQTAAGKATATGGLVLLPQVVDYPPPAPISPPPPTTTTSMGNGFTCSDALCTKVGNEITLSPGYVLGNVSVESGTRLVLRAGTYVVNSLSVIGNNSAIAPFGDGPVIIKVAGQGLSSGAAAIKLTGNSIANQTFKPENMQLIYGGQNDVDIAGNNQVAGIIYAPKASVTITGNSHFYGAIVGASVKLPGQAKLHYDTKLAKTEVRVGNPVMSSFTWRTF